MDVWTTSPRGGAAALPVSPIERQWRTFAWGAFGLMLPTAIVAPPLVVVLLFVHRLALASWMFADAALRRTPLPASREQAIGFTWSVLFWYLPWSRGRAGLALLVGYWCWNVMVTVVTLVSIGVWVTLLGGSVP